jgi:hypothetical protein
MSPDTCAKNKIIISQPQYKLSGRFRTLYKKHCTETLIDASKEVGLEVNVEKTEYMLVSQDQNAGQTREIK